MRPSQAPGPEFESPSVSVSAPDTEGVWRRFAPLVWLYAVLAGTTLVFGLVSHVEADPALDLVIMGIDTAVVLGFVARYWSDLAPLLVVRMPSARATALTLLTSVVFFLVLETAFGVMESQGIPFGSVSADYLDSGWPVWAVYVAVAIAPPFYEELAFRGVLQSALARFVGVREALLLQAALFSVLHLAPIIFLTHFAMGLAFGWIRDKTQSLYPAFVIHALWNGWVVWKELA